MRTIFFATVFIFMIVSRVSAQEVIFNAEQGYYVKDSVLYNGVFFYKENSIERAKKLLIVEQSNHEAVTYYPKDIEEYGFPDGRRFVSAAINLNGSEKNVFLEEVINIQESATIYLYCSGNNEDIFFFSRGKENRLEMINAPDEVWSLLLSLNNCSDVDGIKSFPKKINKNTINVFYNAYKDCNPNLFPRFQFGAVANIGLGKLATNEIPSYSYGFDFAFSVGLFAQLPFDECAALRVEALYSYLENNGALGKGQLGQYENVEYKRYSIQVPLLVRYTFNFMNVKNTPYMEVGPCFDFAFGGGKYNDGILQRPPRETVLDEQSIIDFMYGFSMGAGIEHKINNKKSLHIGLRYNWLKGTRQDYFEKLNFLSLNLAYNLF